MKLFEYFVNLIFWLWAFIVPAGVLAFLGFYHYTQSAQNLPYAILLATIGVFTGILVAERIRKKYGLSHFFSRIMASPDLDPASDETKKEKEIAKVEANSSAGNTQDS